MPTRGPGESTKSNAIDTQTAFESLLPLLASQKHRDCTKLGSAQEVGQNSFRRIRTSTMRNIIALVILAIIAAGFFGLIVPRHVLNTLGFAAADCDSQNC